MKRSEFEGNLLLFGSDIARWQDAGGAFALLRHDEAARALLAEAETMDANLATALAYAPLDRAGLDRLGAITGGGRSWRLVGRQAVIGGALALSIALGGFALGQAAAKDAAMVDATLIALAGGQNDLLGDVQ